MSKTYKEVETNVYEQLGAASALFMSNPQKGTNQIMPEAELRAIAEVILSSVKDFAKTERKSEILTADQRLRDEYAEDWLQFRDDRLAELDK